MATCTPPATRIKIANTAHESILALLLKGPLTAHDLLIGLHKGNCTIGLVAVYKALSSLRDKGFIVDWRPTTAAGRAAREVNIKALLAYDGTEPPLDTRTYELTQRGSIAAYCADLCADLPAPQKLRLGLKRQIFYRYLFRHVVAEVPRPAHVDVRR